MAEISKELISSAEKYSKEYGIPVSVILAFAGNETSFGTAGMGKSKNNVFGIGSKTYTDVDASVKDFVMLVTGNKTSSQSKVYGEATKGAKTVSEWVTAITKAGYNSENKNYISDTLAVYSSYNLGQYDKENVSVGATEKPKESVGLVWWGDIVKVVFIIIIIILGVSLLGFSITNSSPTAKKVVDTVVKKGGKND